MALLAPMPSASVSTATAAKPGALPQLPQREPDVGPRFLEPRRQSHLTVPLSRDRHARPPHALDVGRIDRLAFAAAHLEVEGQLLLDLLLDRHPPQPRPQGSPHWASRMRETPEMNWSHAAVSAASCARPWRVSR